MYKLDLRDKSLDIYYVAPMSVVILLTIPFPSIRVAMFKGVIFKPWVAPPQV
jgi:hypothetical protein